MVQILTKYITRKVSSPESVSKNDYNFKKMPTIQ